MTCIPAIAPPAVATEPIMYRGVAHRATKLFSEATHRVCSPEETLERIRPLLPLAGITRMADITGLDRIGVPTVLSMRPNAPTLSNASGKGFTLTAAMVSAAMEGIELYCAEEEWRFGFETIRSTHRELEEAGVAVDPELIGVSLNSLFHRGSEEVWVLGWDLVTQAEVAVPFDMVGMSSLHRRRSMSELGYVRFGFQVGSNGLASGNAFLEAVCSGISEVIERDAVTCANLRSGHDQRSLPRVDLETIPFERVNELIDTLKARGTAPVLFDCTSDTRIPTYMAYLIDVDIPSTGTFRGYGTHLHPEVAMLRALTESVQSRCVYIAGSRDDLMTLEHRRLRRRQNEVIRQLACPGGDVDATATTSAATSTFEDDCRAMVAAVTKVGLPHVVVIDLTLDEIGVPVVRVIVPGLEGYGSFAHYTPGPRGRNAAQCSD